MIFKVFHCPANDRVREVAKAKAAVAANQIEEKVHPKMLAEPVQVRRQMEVGLKVSAL